MSVRCLILQRDRRILVDTGVRGHQSVEEGLRRFAELQQGAGAYHVYGITDISLWSGVSGGMSGADIVEYLDRNGAVALPLHLATKILDVASRYGQIILSGEIGNLRIRAADRSLLRELGQSLDLEADSQGLIVPDEDRGLVKWKLASQGWPVVDEAAVAGGIDVTFELTPTLALRPYQARAASAFVSSMSSGGVVLLPCGSGKTIVGVAIAAQLGRSTLVVVPSRTIGDQWIEHFLRFTNLRMDQVGWFQGSAGNPPVSIVTYQLLTAKSGGASRTLGLTLDMPWGLVIYDEAQSLPAEVFRQSAALQSRRRLGLSATLVREDGREADVFSLVGPTVWSVPWRDLERRGWIAPVECIELRVPIPTNRPPSDDRILAEKLQAVRTVLRKNPNRPALIVAHRLREVAALSRALEAPRVTGQTAITERRKIFDAFRLGRIPVLVLSRVANVGVDLPDATLLIQVSGAFGSRQEEAQRLGRILRPKRDGGRAYFYSLVVPNTREVDFAARRQRFLIAQGYRYRLLTMEELLGGTEGAADGHETAAH